MNTNFKVLEDVFIHVSTCEQNEGILSYKVGSSLSFLCLGPQAMCLHDQIPQRSADPKTALRVPVVMIHVATSNLP